MPKADTFEAEESYIRHWLNIKTAEQFADLLGYSRAQTWKIVSGKIPASRRFRARIAGLVEKAKEAERKQKKDRSTDPGVLLKEPKSAMFYGEVPREEFRTVSLWRRMVESLPSTRLWEIAEDCKDGFPELSQEIKEILKKRLMG